MVVRYFIKLDWKYLLNQIIHSFTFILSFDEDDRLDGFFINSDKSKCKSLYCIKVEDFLTLLLKISEGDITKCCLHRKVTKLSNGLTEFGEMRQIDAVYEYPEGFDLKKIIMETLSGNIYKRLQC